MSSAQPSRASVPGSPLVRALFLLAALACALPWCTPAMALGLGLVLALCGLAAWPEQSRRLSKLLIQVSVVLMGFGMDLSELARAGALGLAFAAGSIALTFALGAMLGRWLGTAPRLTLLLSSGTAICGGSAIAAVGAATGAAGTEMSVAIATVFVLNGAALYAFPPLGQLLELSQQQFGTWAAVAIHDVSSVVGAASAYGDEALQVATAVKLARTLWIAPVALAAGWWWSRRSAGEPGAGARRSLSFPWFVVWFVAAALLRSAWPALAEFAPRLTWLAKRGMSVALFLIGSGLSLAALRAVGPRPLLLGASLWLIVSVLALFAVRAGLA
jgi:uncharacterized integral membrane protein (TIGR00698 family)